MQLARHSDPRLTINRYGNARLEELGEAVEQLPSLVVSHENPVRNSCTTLALKVDSQGEEVKTSEIVVDDTEEPAIAPEVIGTKRVETNEEDLLGSESSTPDRVRTCNLRFAKPILISSTYFHHCPSTSMT